ncbi:MAG TPA: hypothetical protein VNI84_15475 [Pyrinomonadaceae bacterium]|nr:hypothetical protein [Pyrinomonadaceae bacterium]
MYCSACGTEINTKLNYCKRCGARVDKLEKIGGNKSEALQYLSMATGLGGLALTVGLIAILLNYNVIPQVIVMLTFAFLSAVFGICFLMIQQISSMAKSDNGEKISEKANLPQLGAVSTAQLEEHREPARSVTENTTRTLDKTQI